MDEYETDIAGETEVSEHWEQADQLTRPKWPKVIGILSIVWGSLGLFCGGVGMAMLPFSAKLSGMALKNGEPTPYGSIPTITDYTITGIGFGLALLLLFAGIACVSYRPTTRVMHLVYAGGFDPDRCLVIPESAAQA